MRTYTLNAKVDAATKLMTGMRLPEVHLQLQPYGFSLAALDEGLQRLRQLLLARHGVLDPQAAELEVARPRRVTIRELEAYCARWFPIARAALRGVAPEALHALLGGLRRPHGAHAIPTLTLFLERWDALAAGTLASVHDGPAALVALAARGLTTDVRAEGQRLVSRLVEVAPSLSLRRQALEAEEAALEHLWAWYLEWSVIARQASLPPNSRTALGLG